MTIEMILGVLSYILISGVVAALPNGKVKVYFFTALNLMASWCLFVHFLKQPSNSYYVYIGGVLVSFLFLQISKPSWTWLTLIPVLLPIVFLVAVKSTSFSANVGVSYMAFRLSYAAFEVVTQRTKMPGLAEYLGFAFFSPTLVLGPISPLSMLQNSLREPYRPRFDQVRHAVLRISLGLVKFYIVSTLFSQIGLIGMWKEGYWLTPPRFLVAIIASFLYLYFNFSGFSDVVIGIGNLSGICVQENFDRPFAARNLADFWGRWHISLSLYLKEVFYNPVSLFLMRRVPWIASSHIIAFVTFVTFFLMGIWHGTELNFVTMGALHGFGLVVWHYYSLYIRKLPKIKRQKYLDNRGFRMAATSLALFYAALVSSLFVAPLNDLHRIISSVLW